MKVLGVDFETTGLDPAKDRIIEIGAVLYDTDCGQPVKFMSEFVYEKRKTPILSEFIIKLTGINDDLLIKYGINYKSALAQLLKLAGEADLVIAHHAEFDFNFFIHELGKEKISAVISPWACSMSDIPWNSMIKSKALNHIAADMGFINPFQHRACFDVLTMLKVVQIFGEKARTLPDHEDFDPWDYLKKEVAHPKMTLIANISYDDRKLASDRGFKWNQGEAPKQWSKQVRQHRVPVLMEACRAEFEIIVEEK